MGRFNSVVASLFILSTILALLTLARAQESPSPSASDLPSPSSSGSPSDSLMPSTSDTPSIEPSASSSPSLSASVSFSPSVSPSLSISPSFVPPSSTTESASISPSYSPSITASLSLSPSVVASSASPTPSRKASKSPSASLSSTPSNLPSPSISPSDSVSPSSSGSPSNTPVPCQTVIDGNECVRNPSSMVLVTCRADQFVTGDQYTNVQDVTINVAPIVTRRVAAATKIAAQIYATNPITNTPDVVVMEFGTFPLFSNLTPQALTLYSISLPHLPQSEVISTTLLPRTPYFLSVCAQTLLVNYTLGSCAQHLTGRAFISSTATEGSATQWNAVSVSGAAALFTMRGCEFTPKVVENSAAQSPNSNSWLSSALSLLDIFG